MSQIRNQATLEFTSSAGEVTVSSNIATANLQGPVALEKRTLEEAYHLNDSLYYTITITNNFGADLNNLEINDDLGTYTLPDEVTKCTPLTYTGPANVYINSVFSNSITPTVSDHQIEFQILKLEPGDIAQIVYRVTTNEYAGMDPDTDEITNKLSLTSTEVTTPVTATHTIPVDTYADVSIEKEMHPEQLSTGSTLNYTFIMRNYGNDDATGVALTDIFDPIPSDLVVTMDGTTIEESDYSFNVRTFRLPAESGTTYTFSIPKATITKDTATGKVIIVPSERVLIIRGSI